MFIHDIIYPVIYITFLLYLASSYYFDLDQKDTVVVSLGEEMRHLFYFALYVVKSEWENNAIDFSTNTGIKFQSYGQMRSENLASCRERLGGQIISCQTGTGYISFALRYIYIYIYMAQNASNAEDVSIWWRHHGAFNVLHIWRTDRGLPGNLGWGILHITVLCISFCSRAFILLRGINWYLVLNL